MDPGGVAIRNRAGGGKQETYMDSAETEEESIPIPATDSSGGASYLVMYRVENPFISGEPWPIPSNRDDGPYSGVRVEKCSPTTVSPQQINPGWSAIAFARIDLPASTATVTAEHIVDLRTVANMFTGIQPVQEVINNYDVTVNETTEVTSPIPRSWSDGRIGTGDDVLHGTSTGWTDWPAQFQEPVPIPDWANGVDVFAAINYFVYRDNCIGGLRAVLGGSPTYATDINTNSVTSNNGIHENTIIGTTHHIDKSLRGTTQTFKLQAYYSANYPHPNSELHFRPGCQVYARLDFKQRPHFG
jgi:hypothetical protein